MPEGKDGKKSTTKNVSTGTNKLCADEDLTNSDSDTVWKTPSKLKEEVQTIIDIMGPPISTKFSYNTSSEADNEESVFTNSKFSAVKYKTRCDCNDSPEKSDAPDIPSKDEENISAAADLNTTSLSATIDDLTDPKVNFPYEENYCSNTQYICPPPQLPTNMCLNSECFCPQVASMLHGRGMPTSYISNNYGMPNGVPNIEPNSQKEPSVPSKDSKNGVKNWLKNMVSSSNKLMEKDCNCEYYKMNVKRKRGDDNSPPRRVVFELVQGIPKYDQNNMAINETVQNYYSLKDKKNMDNEKMIDHKVQTNSPCKDTYKNCEPNCPTVFKKPIEKTTYCDTSGKTRVDVYYFDHGSFNHYRTTDAPPIVTTEGVADKTEKHTTRFWAEIFGTIHIGISFITSFILQLFRFLLYSICRPLTIGLIQLASDYFFKPLLATIFNGLIQPMLIFCFNITASLRDICDPISEGIGYFLREIAVLVKALRLVEVAQQHCSCQTDCRCDKKSKKNKNVC